MNKLEPVVVKRLSPEELERLIQDTIDRKVFYAKFLKEAAKVPLSFINLLYEDPQIVNLEDVADIYERYDNALTEHGLFGEPIFNSYRLLHVEDAMEVAKAFVAHYKEHGSQEERDYINLVEAVMASSSKMPGTEADDPADWDL